MHLIDMSLTDIFKFHLPLIKRDRERDKGDNSFVNCMGQEARS